MSLVLDSTAGVTDSITVSSTSGSYSINVPWVTTTSASDTYTAGPNWANNASAKIQLNGPEADIEVNGESLIGMLKAIEQRLNILQPNTELESDWEELRKLGDAYRALESNIQAKMKTWNAIAK
jgi:hypothetical protein